jgi:hypothetical protein
MSGRSVVLTARKVPCPTCSAPRFEYCLGADGEPTVRSHRARVAAARGASDITPAQLEALRKLHADPTRYIEPIVRQSLLRRGLIIALDPSVATDGHRRTRPPKRRHPLTDAGRAAIGVAPAEAKPAEAMTGGAP